jgi:hypothetical protein
VYGRHYPSWRHPVFAMIDVFIVFTAVGWPTWLFLPLALFAADQALEQGLGVQPVLVAVAALMSAWGTWRRHGGVEARRRAESSGSFPDG